MWAKALELVDENMDWLSEDGWVIAQIAPKEYKSLALENLEEFEQRKYGSTCLCSMKERNSHESLPLLR